MVWIFTKNMESYRLIKIFRNIFKFTIKKGWQNSYRNYKLNGWIILWQKMERWNKKLCRYTFGWNKINTLRRLISTIWNNLK